LVLDTYTERDDDGLVVVRDHVRYAPRGHRWTWGTTRILALGGAASLDKEWRLAEEGRRSAKAIRKSKFREAAGGAPAPPPNYAGTLWFPDEELSDDDVETVLADGTPVDLLLTHDKPRRSRLGFNRKDDAAAWPNQDRVQRVVDAYGPLGSCMATYTFATRIASMTRRWTGWPVTTTQVSLYPAIGAKTPGWSWNCDGHLI